MRQFFYSFLFCIIISFGLHFGAFQLIENIKPEEKPETISLDVESSDEMNNLKDKLAKIGEKLDQASAGVKTNQPPLGFKGFATDEDGVCPPNKIYIGFGASFQVNEELKTAMKVLKGNSYFLIVKELKPNGPLDRAGVKIGDLIEESVVKIMSFPEGTQQDVLIWHNNQLKKYRLTSERLCFY